MTKSNKRKRNRTGNRDEALSQPSVWRRQHGGFTPPFRDTDPETGAAVSHRRAIDLLGTLEANGTISAAMHDAGDAFLVEFRAAVMDSPASAPLLRLPAGAGETITERVANARRKIAEAMVALGGADSAAGSCIWHVVGCETSIREWAGQRGWGGRSVGHAQAQGILVASLGVLAGHYGLETKAPVRRSRRKDNVMHEVS